MGVFTTYRAVLFGANFDPRHQLPLSGVPSRARISPDGRRAAVTVFETGHSYTAAFSTRTSLIDVETGDLAVPTLEAFTVLRDDAETRSPDFNIWGVTFARDSDRFYATLATGGQTYLVEGSVAARTLRILRGHVECPSLSPDNRRIAFKKRLGGMLGPITWRLTVLDLLDGRRTRACRDAECRRSGGLAGRLERDVRRPSRRHGNRRLWTPTSSRRTEAARRGCSFRTPIPWWRYAASRRRDH